ncbi:hypothetical protein B0I35DRAFT_415039 [Stachybotrys elegans]|uniref:Uncharacterized protein n=1 Tax=Stachybotrys elegans TaxID=80388 RepID=A0A8K0WKN5_9HYPO|nr:hypothetical protein B0I35DRAFT_500567 [Stachybotrys elegans]KAH7303579.1 hypothetical protein B0I35DRAFT_415039 [Stachybotrys elegans]
MDTLPFDERQQVWDETECNFWSNIRHEWETTWTEAGKHQQAILDHRVEMATITGRLSQLSKAEEILAEQLAQVKADRVHLAQQYNYKTNQLLLFEKSYQKDQQKYLEMRKKAKQTIPFYCQEMRSSSAANLSRPSCDHTPISSTRGSEGNPEQSVNGPIIMPSRKPLVDIVHVDGSIVGPVLAIEPWNHRPVKIRRGREFNQDHLSAIYERTESKGDKWLSCMIQATGKIQPRRCISCQKNQGVFDDCIIIGGEMFNRCGNCEWNHQGCHGASGEPLDLDEAPQEDTATQLNGTDTNVMRVNGINGHADQRKFSDGDLQTRLLESRGVVNVESREAVNVEPREVNGRHRTSEGGSTIHELVNPLPRPKAPDVMGIAYIVTQETEELQARRAQALQDATAKASGLQCPPTPVSRVLSSAESEVRAPLPANTREHISKPGVTPVNVRSRPPYLDLHTPTAGCTGNASPQLYAPEPNLGWAYDQSCEINQHNLVLRDNGVVFTYPPCIEDVPVAKIDRNHPYWERSWTDLGTLIEPALQIWREKHKKAVRDESSGEKCGTFKYHTRRQVKRGVKILKFLETGDISPYQLLAKQYLQSARRGITSYDTLFRLVDTLEELEKYRLDIKPVDWLRYRLHELISEQGADFNFLRTIRNFYHDAKLKYLREKCGFKTIMGRSSSGKPPKHAQSGTPQPKPLKRKTLHNQASTPTDTPISRRSPSVGHMSLPPDLPSGGVITKRLRHTSPALASGDELYPAQLSEADSCYGSPLTAHDWRLYQVKTRLYTSSNKVIQHWTWRDDTKRFEHQVLTESSPATWGVLREPINFDLRLDEMVRISYNLQALHISILVNTERPVIAKKDGKPRGQIMAAFKRERTMKRFLRFCRDKGVRLAEIGGDEVMRMWDLMPSGQLPDGF